MSASSSVEAELIELSRQLLISIGQGDWASYAALCAEDITCFEPEARGHLVEGMDFHRFYFELGGHMGANQSTMAAARVKLLGDSAALVTYTRLVQSVDEQGDPGTRAFEETRIWEKIDGAWKHIHFHRSCAS